MEFTSIVRIKRKFINVERPEVKVWRFTRQKEVSDTSQQISFTFSVTATRL